MFVVQPILTIKIFFLFKFSILNIWLGTMQLNRRHIDESVFFLISIEFSIWKFSFSMNDEQTIKRCKLLNSKKWHKPFPDQRQLQSNFDVCHSESLHLFSRHRSLFVQKTISINFTNALAEWKIHFQFHFSSGKKVLSFTHPVYHWVSMLNLIKFIFCSAHWNDSFRGTHFFLFFF